MRKNIWIVLLLTFVFVQSSWAKSKKDYEDRLVVTPTIGFEYLGFEW